MWNDYGARWLDLQRGVWGQIDPLAEKYAAWSGYNYALGNPINKVDIGGQYVLEFAGIMMGQYSVKFSRVTTTQANTLDFLSAFPNPYANLVGYSYRSLNNDPSYKNSGAKSVGGDIKGDVIAEGVNKSFIEPPAKLLSELGDVVGKCSKFLGSMVGDFPDIVAFAKRDYTELYLDELTFEGAQAIGLGKVTLDGGFSMYPQLVMQGEREYGNFIVVGQMMEADLDNIKLLIRAEAERNHFNLSNKDDFEKLKQIISDPHFYDNRSFQSFYNSEGVPFRAE